MHHHCECLTWSYCCVMMRITTKQKFLSEKNYIFMSTFSTHQPFQITPLSPTSACAVCYPEEFLLTNHLYIYSAFLNSEACCISHLSRIKKCVFSTSTVKDCIFSFEIFKEKFQVPNHICQNSRL